MAPAAPALGCAALAAGDTKSVCFLPEAQNTYTAHEQMGLPTHGLHPCPSRAWVMAQPQGDHVANMEATLLPGSMGPSMG